MTRSSVDFPEPGRPEHGEEPLAVADVQVDPVQRDGVAVVLDDAVEL